MEHRGQFLFGPSEGVRVPDDASRGPHHALNLIAHQTSPLGVAVVVLRLGGSLGDHRANLLHGGVLLGAFQNRLERLKVVGQSVRAGSKRTGGEHHSLEQGVGREPVGAVKPRARRLTAREQSVQRSLAVEVGANAAAEVVRRRDNRDAVGRHVQPAPAQLGGDAREVLQDVVRGEVAHVEVDAPRLLPSLRRRPDLAVDGPRHHVAGRQLQPVVVPGHEPLTRVVEQPPAVAADSLGDEEGVLVGFFLTDRATRAGVEGRWVELVKFHVCHVGTRSHRHGDAVPGAHARVGGAREELPRAAGREEGAARQERDLGAVLPSDDLGAHAPIRVVCLG
mmetsp:Transcript_6732/g.30378  ORF Transcript_6732/g.30378 Transcript_6732/m.30378 type:complete len:336 (+) Transcript_6732:465-1472(+)